MELTKNQKSIPPFTLLVLFLLSLSAQSAPMNSIISAASGVAAPSSGAALSENPVGLLYAQGLGLGLSAHSSDSSFKDPAYGADLGYSRRDWGVSAGIETATRSSNSVTNGNFGVALHLSSLKFAVGLSGQTQLSPSGGGTDYNLGVILAPFSQMRLGFMAMSLEGGFDEFAAGVAYGSNSALVIALDASTDKDFKKIQAQPGVLLQSSHLSLGVSYGLVVSGGGNGESNSVNSRLLSDGISVGAGLKVGSKTSLSGHYKHLDKIYLQLGFDL